MILPFPQGDQEMFTRYQLTDLLINGFKKLLDVQLGADGTGDLVNHQKLGGASFLTLKDARFF